RHRHAQFQVLPAALELGRQRLLALRADQFHRLIHRQTGTQRTGQKVERVRQLVLVSTTSAFPPKGKEALAHLAHLAETQGMRAVADAFAPRLFGSVIDLKLDDRFQALAAAFTEQDPASFAAACRALALADVTPELSKIQTETLLVYGENDRQTPPFFGEALVSKLPNARMVVVPKLGHVLPIEDPKTFNRILLEFLR
ncbi:MAG TPA: alpha/beta hydrolase, partial [Acidobacteriota bacterium]|nr:alpha/beta hydrolase [Acidobacteriota bacterium]